MMPRSILAKVDERMVGFFHREQMLEEQIKGILEGRNKDNKTNAEHGHGTIFHDIIFKSKLPPEDLELSRLRDEGQGLVAAGAVTTERSLYLITYYLLVNPEMLHKLREELCEPMQGYPEVKPRWKDLEKLPYLSAVIQEGFRFDSERSRLTRYIGYVLTRLPTAGSVTGQSIAWHESSLTTISRTATGLSPAVRPSVCRRNSCTSTRRSSQNLRNTTQNAGCKRRQSSWLR